MQNKGAIRIFAILLGLACLFYLSFKVITLKIEGEAKTYAEKIANKPEILDIAKTQTKGDHIADSLFRDSIIRKETNVFLDSVRKLPVDFPLYSLAFTYEDCKEHEINLGLDLKGGMNVTLEVSVEDIIRNMSAKPDDAKLNLAIGKARVREIREKRHLAELFAEELKALDKGASLASYFRSEEMKGKIDFNTPDETVIKLIKERVDESIATSEKTLRARIDKFGVTQPNIQKLESQGRILIELPGVNDKKRVEDLLQGTANLEFWETYDVSEVYGKIQEADKRLSEMFAGIKTDTIVAGNDSLKNDSLTKAAKANTNDSLSTLSKLGMGDTSKKSGTASKIDTSALAKQKREHPLINTLLFQIADNTGKQLMPGPVVGVTPLKDTAKVMRYLHNEKIARIFSDNIRFAWTVKPPYPYKDDAALSGLVALKVTRRDKKAALSGDIMTDARKEFDQRQGGKPHITMTMTDEASQTWAEITGDVYQNSKSKAIAIVLDDAVYSYPNVQGKITGGTSQITGDFSIREVDDMVNILKAGKMPARARIVEETVVGPTLGAESIRNGVKSFAIALLLVFLFMMFYYSKAGVVADIVLMINTFFIIGVLASLGAVLTLPGIAGLVLVVGISVDANVLIFERIREELREGKGIQLAVADGYKHALSSILDSNITTILLGIILYAYGSGPVQGFATTLIIGILCSLFCAIFISRMVFEMLLSRKMNISFSIPLTQNAFKNINIDFVKSRKLYYIFSSAIILTGAVFFFKHGGFKMGVDFKGGRSYYVRFDKPVETGLVSESLRKPFDGESREVKTFGSDNQVRITTSYMIDDTSATADQTVESKLNAGLGTLGNHFTIVQSQKVGGTISRDLRNNAIWTILFSCALMFLYILIRFKGWQYGLGATVALFHDVAVVLSCYTIFDGLLPFTLEINQDFIAAILTVMGYSMTDTVVVFDRIREYLNEKGKNSLIPGEEKNRIINYALNTTLSRTMITSLITFFVLVAIFLFGGEVIRSFAFALLIGIIIGTYSSICIATPIVIDFDRAASRKSGADNTPERKKEAILE